MRPDDPAVVEVLRTSKIARIATQSRGRRPNITPLYFVRRDGRIWLGTPAWTYAARNVRADPRVSVLFDPSQNTSNQGVLRVTGRAEVRTDQRAQRLYNPRVARKYLLTPGAIRNALTHLRQLPLKCAYHAQSAERGHAAVIVVTAEHAEFLTR
jgi:general stress protein 26